MSGTKAAESATVEKARKALVDHPLYGRLQSFDDAKVFTKHHVFAVWDFFSLLKRLQREVTSLDLPWTPKGMSDHARFIMDIVISEECDENISSGYISHFELYHAAMEEIGADHGPIDRYQARLVGGGDPIDALAEIGTPQFVQDFVSSTLEVALNGEPHEVAASFCHGRENLLPDVLTGVQSGLGSSLDSAPILKHYLARHITLDHDEHGPLALRLLDALCGGDSQRIERASQVGVEAIEARRMLWDGILAELESG